VGGFAENEAAAGTEGLASFVEDELLFFRNPIVQDIEEQNGVAERIFPFEQVLEFEADMGHLSGGLFGDADFVFVVIDTKEGAGVAAIIEPV